MSFLTVRDNSAPPPPYELAKIVKATEIMHIIHAECIVRYWLQYTRMVLNSCVLFCLLKDKRVFSGFSTRRWSQTLKRPPTSPTQIWRRFFWAHNFFSKIFSPEVWPEVSRKSIDLTSRPKLYELRQHPHTISFLKVLVVQSKTWVCLLRQKTDQEKITIISYQIK